MDGGWGQWVVKERVDSGWVVKEGEGGQWVDGWWRKESVGGGWGLGWAVEGGTSYEKAGGRNDAENGSVRLWKMAEKRRS